MMTRVCRWCDESTTAPVCVGVEHVASSAGRAMFACPACRATWGLLRYEDHPLDSDGRPRTTAGTLVLPRFR